MNAEKIDLNPGLIAQKVFGPGGAKVILLGAPGSGKSTLAAGLAANLATKAEVLCLAVDPGSPPFGAPGAANLGRWNDGAWTLIHSEAVCSLDAARYRMPLVFAAMKLMEKVAGHDLLIIDMPGVYRGAAGAELFWHVVRITGADSAIALTQGDTISPLANELAAAGLRVFLAPQSPKASCLSKKKRAIARTALWEKYLDGASTISIDASATPLLGAPPPLQVAEAWQGRQAALLDASGVTLAMGEITSMAPDGVITARMLPHIGQFRSLLVRDAVRDVGGLIRTCVAKARWQGRSADAPDMAPYGLALGAHGPVYATKVGQAGVALLNGVFGDPLLHLRLRDRKRSVLFDLGEATRLSARIAHQVSDVFISHAHVDHIGGFLWLLRSRIGLFPLCRVFGPPGLAANIQGLVDGIHWDRVADRGPVFEVAELHGAKMILFRVEAGKPGAEPIGSRNIVDGVILEDSDLLVRAVELDHGTPVIAYALEQPATLNIRKDRLLALGLPPGPWLAELKSRILSGDMDSTIAPPDGLQRPVKALAEELVIHSHGAKLVYATDLGDTQQNREKLIRLAQGADILFLEASFTQADKDQATATWHLTASACGQIAAAAGVKRLAPFHFSRRYERAPELPLAEVRQEFSHIIEPGAGG